MNQVFNQFKLNLPQVWWWSNMAWRCYSKYWALVETRRGQGSR